MLHHGNGAVFGSQAEVSRAVCTTGSPHHGQPHQLLTNVCGVVHGKPDRHDQVEQRDLHVPR